MNSTAISSALGDLPLAQVEKGQAPKKRIVSARVAWQIADRIKRGATTLTERRTHVKGMFDGNAPHRRSDLEASGQGNRTNVNWREAAALRSMALSPYYDLLTSVPVLAQVAYDDPETSEVVDPAFHELLWSDADFHFCVCHMLNDFMGYGSGFLGRNDKVDWQAEYWPHNHVFFPSQSCSRERHLEVFAYRQIWDPATLYHCIENEDAARELGWNPAQVKLTLARAMGYDPASHDDYVMVQQDLKDGSWSAPARTAVVSTWRVYVKEFSGKWTGVIVSEDFENEEFMQEAYEHYDELGAILSPFIFEPRDDTWGGVIGLGDDLLAPMGASDRLRNNTVDGGIRRGSMLLKAANPNAEMVAGLVQVGDVTCLPDGWDLQAGNLLADLDGPIKVLNDLSQLVQSVTGVYRPQFEQGGGNPRTATEFTTEWQQAQRLSSSAIGRWYVQWDRWLAETFRRVVNTPNADGPSNSKSRQAALAFIKRCEDGGVDLATLRKYRSVRATRALGNGSPALRLQALASVKQLVGAELPEEGRNRLTNYIISACVGPEQIRLLNPPPENQTGKQEQVRLAAMENGLFKAGNPLPIADTDDHVSHADTHLAAASGAVQTLPKGGNPMEVLRFLDMAIPHSIQHVQALAEDPTRKAIVKALSAHIQDLAKVSEKIKERMQQQAQQQAEAQQKMGRARAIQAGVDPDTQIKAAQMQGKMRLQAEQVRNRIAQRTEAHRQKLAQDAESHRQEMALKDAETASNIRRKRVATQPG